MFILLINEYHFRPWELIRLTPSEIVLYHKALIAKAEANNPKQTALDRQLDPAYEDKENAELNRGLEVVRLCNQLSAEQMIELGQRLST